MKQVAVFLRRDAGVLLPCPVCPTPDGACWRCGLCRAIVIRVAFGVMNGLWRCQCGAEVALFVDGEEIDIEGMHSELPEVQHGEAKELNDSDFLRELGITPDLATTED